MGTVPPSLPPSLSLNQEVEHQMEFVFAVPKPHYQPNSAVIRPDETPTPLTDLAAALNHAAKVLTSASSSSAAVASLRNAHQLIGSFLAQLDSQPPAGDEDEQMSDRREEEGEGERGEGSRIIDEVEEGMRECVLQSKRRKRQVSPSWALGRAADQGEEFLSVHPMDRRRSSIDLVFQFHA